MKKLLIAICLLLVFGITSAAISYGRGGFGSASTGGSSGGGSPDVISDTRVSHASSADGGSFASPQGSGSTGYYMLTGGAGQHAEDAPVAGQGGDYGSTGQGNAGLEAWLQRYAAPFSNGYRSAANDDSVGDGFRNAYSPEAAVARMEHLGAANPGTSSYISAASATVPLIPAPVPEPETYAMLLAGLCLVGVVARRRKARQI